MIILFCVFLTTFFAGMLQAAVGFGSGLVSMAVFPYLLGSIPRASALSGAFALPSVAYSAFRQRKTIRWRNIAIICLLNAGLMPVFTRIAQKLPIQGMMVFLGIAMLAISCFFLFFQEQIHMKASLKGTIATGVLAGAMDGLFALSGVVVGTYLVGVVEDKNEYYGSMAAFLVVSCTYSSTVRVIMGVIDHTLLPHIVVGALGMLVGASCGRRLSAGMKLSGVKRLVYIVVGLCGLYNIINGIF